MSVRIIAATHRNLDIMVQQGTFRADLFHRLHVLAIHIPPLRERPADLQPLIEHFLEKHHGLRPAGALSAAPEFLEALTQLPLPGNARQLENLVRWALVNKDDETPLTLRDLPSDIWQQLSEQEREPQGQSAPGMSSRPSRHLLRTSITAGSALLDGEPLGHQRLEPRTHPPRLRTAVARSRAAQGTWQSITRGPTARDHASQRLQQSPQVSPPSLATSSPSLISMSARSERRCSPMQKNCSGKLLPPSESVFRFGPPGGGDRQRRV